VQTLSAGDRFGSLILWRPTKLGRHRGWMCLCICGATTNVRAASLYTGGTRSCGGAIHRIRNIHAGGRNSRTYQSWRAMRKRCNDPKNISYLNYGGIGVRVCTRWNDSTTGYAMFVLDMGVRPSGMTLDRRDPFGSYEPTNCRWATAIEQEHNKRHNHAQFVDELREYDYWDQQEAAFLNA
jgi:hypothetical protein